MSSSGDGGTQSPLCHQQRRNNVETSAERLRRSRGRRSTRRNVDRRHNSPPPHSRTLELDVIGQPPRVVQLGSPVEVSAVITLRNDSPDDTTASANVDASPLIAVATLVKDTGNGERLPLEAGSLVGQKMFDSVHPVAEEYLDAFQPSKPSRTAVGYVCFPGLVIRQLGSYRIRTTLIKMGENLAAGATSLLMVDSDPIKVERNGCWSITQRP